MILIKTTASKPKAIFLIIRISRAMRSVRTAHRCVLRIWSASSTARTTRSPSSTAPTLPTRGGGTLLRIWSRRCNASTSLYGSNRFVMTKLSSTRTSRRSSWMGWTTSRKVLRKPKSIFGRGSSSTRKSIRLWPRRKVSLTSKPSMLAKVLRSTKSKATWQKR